jgi:acetoin utilization deacetylase AcuC-like enzyme
MQSSGRRVAVAYDPIHLRHNVARHPEQPGRVEAIMQRLDAGGRLAGLQQLTPREASDAELELIHPASHVDYVRRLDESGGGRIDADTRVVPGTFAAATHAAGGTLAAVDAVLDGAADATFAVVRPPGHHATANQAMGFCYFNNVAIAAAYARRNHGVGRIAIADYDVHHGNGTQDVFWNDPDLLYLSLHQYPFYPGSGHWRETGGPGAEGATVNVPLQAGCGDAEYLRVFDRLFLPLVERFQPELLLVSAGYDAHAGDPLAGMEVSTAAYGAIVRRLRAAADALCGGRLVATLEGGYDLNDLAASVEASIDALTGAPPAYEPAPPAGEVFERYLDGLRELHRVS